MSRLIFSFNAQKDFARLSLPEREKVFKKLKTLEKEPLSGKLLVGKLRGLRSLRAWPYRIVYQVRQPNKVLVLKIFHRQKGYK